MSADAKAQSLEKVEASPGSKRKVLSELGVSKSDCYRWRARQKQRSLENRQHPGPSGNPLSPSEESMVLEVALDQTKTTGGVDHRQQRLLGRRVQCVSTPQASETGKES